jgi:heme-degrading monooxygenase HmoA
MSDNEFIVIDTIGLPAERLEEFIEQWRKRSEIASKAKGFRDARLHRAVEPGPIPLVMVAHWDSAEARDSALSDSAFQASAGVSGDYAEVQGGAYQVAAEYRSGTAPKGPGITFVNAFEMPADRIDEFVTHWHGRASLMAQAPGFRDNRLHRAVDPQARFQLVNIAHWDSPDAWRAAGNNPAFQQRLAAAPTFATANPALYDVVAEFSASS